jgi:2-oxoglutarate ferredoxin oxidoreductase subunit beta
MIVDVDDVGEESLLVHDAHATNPGQAFALAHLAELPTGPTPIGVFRDIRRPVYAEPLTKKLETEHGAAGTEQIDGLLRSGDTWTVE